MLAFHGLTNNHDYPYGLIDVIDTTAGLQYEVTSHHPQCPTPMTAVTDSDADFMALLTRTRGRHSMVRLTARASAAATRSGIDLMKLAQTISSKMNPETADDIKDLKGSGMSESRVRDAITALQSRDPAVKSAAVLVLEHVGFTAEQVEKLKIEARAQSIREQTMCGKGPKNRARKIGKYGAKSGVREPVNETRGLFRTLSDASHKFPQLADGQTQVWYRRTDEAAPVDIACLSRTHVLLGCVAERQIDFLSRLLCSDWNASGVANGLFERKGLARYRMTAGDVIVNNNGVWLVEKVGFKLLGQPPRQPSNKIAEYIVDNPRCTPLSLRTQFALSEQQAAKIMEAAKQFRASPRLNVYWLTEAIRKGTAQ